MHHLLRNVKSDTVDCDTALLRISVDTLCQLRPGIEAEMWNSEVPIPKRERIAKDIRSCEPCVQLIYCTPEALQEQQQRDGNPSPSLLQAIEAAKDQNTLRLVAVDEAHVLSAW